MRRGAERRSEQKAVFIYGADPWPEKKLCHYSGRKTADSPFYLWYSKIIRPVVHRLCRCP